MGILIPLMALAIPLAAVIGSYYLKIQKMKLEGDGSLLLRTMAERMKKMEEENRSLRERVENLEVIVTDDAYMLPPVDEKAKAYVPPTAKQMAEEMAKKARNS